jgi:hypothetical protein
MHNDNLRSCTFIHPIGHPAEREKRDHRYNPDQTTRIAPGHSKGVHRIFQCVVLLLVQLPGSLVMFQTKISTEKLKYKRYLPLKNYVSLFYFFTVSPCISIHYIYNGPTNALVCNWTLIQTSHTKTLKITPTCFDLQMIIIRELFDSG